MKLVVRKNHLGVKFCRKILTLLKNGVILIIFSNFVPRSQKYHKVVGFFQNQIQKCHNSKLYIFCLAFSRRSKHQCRPAMLPFLASYIRFLIPATSRVDNSSFYEMEPYKLFCKSFYKMVFI